MTLTSKPSPTTFASKASFYLLCLMIIYGCTKKLIPDPEPEVSFTIQNNDCTAPCEVTFVNTSKNASSFTWDFADGTFSTEANPKHTFQNGGAFEVKLTADGKFTFYKYAMIKGPQVTASAAFEVEGSGCNAPCSVKFVNKSTYSTSYKWDFGDGKTSTETSPSHVFEKAGNYSVSLQAAGDKSTSSISRSVVIQSAVAQVPAIVWDKTFGGSGEDILVTVLSTSDNGYLLGGYSNSQPSGNKSAVNYGGHDFYIVKTDESGNKIWDKTYGGGEDDILHAMISMPDGSILLGGESQSYYPTAGKSAQGFGGRDFWFIKIDGNGNKLWDKSFGGNGDEILYGMTSTKDGALMVAGTTSPGTGNDGNSDFLLVKVDTGGNKLWSKAYGSSQVDLLQSIITLDNGDLLLAGASNSETGGSKTAEKIGNFDFWLVKADANGNKLWDKSYGTTGRDILKSVTKMPDGNLVLGGTALLPNPANFDLAAIKINEDGNKLIDFPLTMPGTDEFGAIAISSDQNLLLGGRTTNLNDTGKSDIFLTKTDLSGKIIWKRTIGEANAGTLSSILSTPVAGIIIGANSYTGPSGEKTSPNYGNVDFWILKLR